MLSRQTSAACWEMATTPCGNTCRHQPSNFCCMKGQTRMCVNKHSQLWQRSNSSSEFPTVCAVSSPNSSLCDQTVFEFPVVLRRQHRNSCCLLGGIPQGSLWGRAAPSALKLLLCDGIEVFHEALQVGHLRRQLLRAQGLLKQSTHPSC